MGGGVFQERPLDIPGWQHVFRHLQGHGHAGEGAAACRMHLHPVLMHACMLRRQLLPHAPHAAKRSLAGALGMHASRLIAVLHAYAGATLRIDG